MLLKPSKALMTAAEGEGTLRTIPVEHKYRKPVTASIKVQSEKQCDNSII